MVSCAMLHKHTYIHTRLVLCLEAVQNFPGGGSDGILVQSKQLFLVRGPVTNLVDDQLSPAMRKGISHGRPLARRSLS